MNKSLCKLKTFFEYYIQETVTKSNERAFKELAIQRISKEAKLVPMMFVGFLVISLFLALGLGALTYSFSQYLFFETSLRQSSLFFSGLLMFVIGVIMIILLLKYVSSVISGVEKIATTKTPKDTLFSPFVCQIQKERLGFMKELK